MVRCARHLENELNEGGAPPGIEIAEAQLTSLEASSLKGLVKRNHDSPELIIGWNRGLEAFAHKS